MSHLPFSSIPIPPAPTIPSTVAIRTYQSLEFFDVTEGDQLLRSREELVDLRTLREAQGEGAGFGDNGAIVLSSEGAGGAGPTFTFLSCDQS